MAVREQVAFTPTQLESALAELRSLPHISEAAVLSTCNRTELYCVTDAAGEQIVLDWLVVFIIYALKSSPAAPTTTTTTTLLVI